MMLKEITAAHSENNTKHVNIPLRTFVGKMRNSLILKQIMHTEPLFPTDDYYYHHRHHRRRRRRRHWQKALFEP
jgi:hypothetical protein